MAYISGEDTRAIARALKKNFPNTKFSVRNCSNSSVTVSILSAPDSFMDNPDGTPMERVSINHYHLGGYKHQDVLKKMLQIINTAGSRPNYDNSDAMTDYFDVGYYVNIQQGTYGKPFVIKKAKKRK